MTKSALLIGLSALVLCGLSCKQTRNTVTGPNGSRAAKTIYVNSTWTGPSEGTVTHPYTSITAALTSGVAGDTLQIAAGIYDSNEVFPLRLKPGNVLIGAGRASTMIHGQIEDINAGVTTPIVLRSLNAVGFSFARDAAAGAVAGFNLIRQCEFRTTVQIIHGGRHNFTIDSSTFQHGLEFKHGPGGAVNRVLFNDISDTLEFSTGDGPIDYVVGNTIVGGALIYKSGVTDAYISANDLSASQLIDLSGAGVQIITSNDISFSAASQPIDSAAVILKGMSVTFTHNTVGMASGNGIVAMSGSPTIIDSNYAGASFGCCILTKAGAGQVVGNETEGGTCGIFDQSGATLIAQNSIRRADTGLYSAGNALIDNNSITYCTGDGVILAQTTGAFQNNIVWYNKNGVRIVSGSPDLGGGIAGSVGINYLQSNTEYDLINYSSASVMAKYNHWDHTTSSDIQLLDIYDQFHNANCGAVVFEPFQP